MGMSEVNNAYNKSSYNPYFVIYVFEKDYIIQVEMRMGLQTSHQD